MKSLQPMDEQGGLISRPGSSPDLTPCEFFLRENMKEKVYQERPQNINQLKKKRRQPVATITQNKSRKIHANMKLRLVLVVREQERHFKHLLDCL